MDGTSVGDEIEKYHCGTLPFHGN